jgi:putative hydrolase
MGARNVTADLNRRIASKLEEAAELLETQGANPFRVGAYRRAAATVVSLERDVADILEQEGLAGLTALPTIGKGIASAIWEMVRTGRWSQLERWRGSLEPEALLRTVPGIGPALAKNIHDELHIDTLEQLEAAAWDGRLDGVTGIGRRKLEALRASLGAILGRARTVRRRLDGPDVAVLLDVDRRYRNAAEAGRLPTIAPKRFNPSGESWLPILHREQDGWHFTALYSNTARAHQLHKVRDWVVIYFYDSHHEEGQHTVVTETRGALTGQRVVRGREAECREFYRASGNREGG